MCIRDSYVAAIALKSFNSGTLDEFLEFNATLNCITPNVTFAPKGSILYSASANAFGLSLNGIVLTGEASVHGTSFSSV